MDLEYQKLTKENYFKVLEIKHKLFPESSSDEDYENYFNNVTKSNYYLILLNNVPCATIGWYEFDSKNAFIGWFGVLKEFQNKGIGSQILNYVINEIKLLNYAYVRVYTDKVENFVSTKLYKKLFDLEEAYTYPDKLGSTGNFVIYSKFLTNENELWNNRPLNEDDNYNF